MIITGELWKREKCIVLFVPFLLSFVMGFLVYFLIWKLPRIRYRYTLTLRPYLGEFVKRHPPQNMHSRWLIQQCWLHILPNGWFALCTICNFQNKKLDSI